MPNKSLRFVLPLCLLCGTILTFPFWLPRVLSGTNLNEPDVKPVLTIDAGGAFANTFEWSKDGKQLSYLAARARRSNWGTVEKVERAWPDGRELSRHVLEQGNLSDLVSRFGQPSHDWEMPARTTGNPEWTIVIESRKPTRLNGPSLRHLQVKRAGKVIRSWPVPSYTQTRFVRNGTVDSSGEAKAFLSPDNRLAAFLAEWDSKTQNGSPVTPVRLRDFVFTDRIKNCEWRVFRVSDGKLIQQKRFTNQLQWVEKGRLWLGEFSPYRPVDFDGRSLWVLVTPADFPLDAPRRLQQVKDAYLSIEAAERSFHKDYLYNNIFKPNSWVWYDVLGKQARWFEDRPKRRLPNNESTWYWRNVFSFDRQMVAAKYSVFVVGQPSSKILCVWDARSRRLLWRQIPLESRSDMMRFSPDNRKLAVVESRYGPVRQVSSIHIFDARTGKKLGPPLVEESPRDRTADFSTEMQTPFKNGLKRTTDFFAKPGTRTPTPQLPSDEFFDFEWTPDSLHIVAHHRDKLKIWRVP